jgi:hypothetical protein
MADANDIAQWQQCPVCHRGEISGGSIQVDGLEAWQLVSCDRKECEATWNEVYVASYRENIERGGV